MGLRVPAATTRWICYDVYLNSGQVGNLYADHGLAEADISDKPEPTAEEKMADALPQMLNMLQDNIITE